MCRIALAREWAVRLVHELESHNDNIFVTLTYDKEHLPSDQSVRKIILQKYMKRLRKVVQEEEEKRIKFYSCGEYGFERSRPHYHLLIYGLGLRHKKLIQDLWKNGHVEPGYISFFSARYVAGYVFEKYGSDKDGSMIGRERPFNLMSKGLGKEFVIKNKNRLEKDKCVTIGGIPVGLPKYYRMVKDKNGNKILNIDPLELHKERLARDDEIADKIAPRYKHKDADIYRHFMKVRFKKEKEFWIREKSRSGK